MKYRADNSFGAPCEAVGPKKQKKLIKLAYSYILVNKIKDKDMRFDVVEVCGEEINLIKNAFPAKN